MRQLWNRGPAVIAIGALALGVGAWWGLVRGSDAPERERSSARSVDAPVVSSDVLDLVPGCTVDTCRPVARRGGFRFMRQDATFMVVANSAKCGQEGAVSLHLVTASAVLWSRAVDGLCLDPVGGVRTDRTGNAFVVLPSGAHIVDLYVLRVRGDRVEDFGSLDGAFRGDEPTGARDLDGDDILEIVVVGNDCDPDCPDGATNEHIFRWNGTEYVTADG